MDFYEVLAQVIALLQRTRPSSPTMLDMYVRNPLSMKHFHGVSVGNVHECSLISSIGKVSGIRTAPLHLSALICKGLTVYGVNSE